MAAILRLTTIQLKTTTSFRTVYNGLCEARDGIAPSIQTLAFTLLKTCNG
jgi:hypothetical protein